MNAKPFSNNTSDLAQYCDRDPRATDPESSTTKERKETTMHSTTKLKQLMNLLVVLTILSGLTASRAAHAQGLNLGLYSSYLTLTDQNTHNSYGASLAVTQDSLGNLSGWMSINSAEYQVTGTVSWAGPYWPNWYWLDITATWHSDTPWWELPASSQIYLADWIYVDGDWLEFLTGDYSWYFQIGWSLPTTPTTGTFSGYGFQPPH